MQCNQKILLCGTAILTTFSPLAPTAVFAEEVDADTLLHLKDGDANLSKEAEDKETDKSTKDDKEASKDSTEKSDESTKDEKNSVEDKISSLVQETPNYEINLDENQDYNVKKMIVDVANKTDIQKGETVEVKQEEKNSISLSPIEAIKVQAQTIQKDIEDKETTSTATEIISLGNTEYKEFNTETKKDETKTQENYLFGNHLISVQNYDRDNVGDNQDVHLESRALSTVQEQMLSVAQASKDSKTIQTVIDSVTASAGTENVGSTNIIVRNKDVTAPDIQLTTSEVNVEKGDSFDVANYVSSVTDNGQNLDYTVDGAVDNTTPGSYVVTVNATDIDGNTTSKNITVNVLDDYWQRIADAALAQLGRTQDCTMLVTNSLAAVGINFHGWPEEYLSLGPTTNNPVPGDIIVYSGHVAIYIGDGKAVHGGWLGTQTVISSVNCGNAFIAYVHPNRV